MAHSRISTIDRRPAAVGDAATRSPGQIARRSGSSFLVSFGVLGRERRRALTAIYAYCRLVDDAVDDAPDPEAGRAALGFWSEELDLAAGGEPRSPVGRALRDAMRRFGVGAEHLRGVVDGVAMDLDRKTFATFDELEAYCYCVASSVGLACLPVFGASGPDAEQYATHLGHALQLTNILRDLRTDALGGRVYVPSVLLSRLGIERSWLEGRGPDRAYGPGGPMAELTAELAARAGERFERAAARLRPELRRALLPAEIMGAVYRELLARLQRRGGAICRGRRVRVPGWRKLLLALAVRRQVRAGR